MIVLLHAALMAAWGFFVQEYVYNAHIFLKSIEKCACNAYNNRC